MVWSDADAFPVVAVEQRGSRADRKVEGRETRPLSDMSWATENDRRRLAIGAQG